MDFITSSTPIGPMTSCRNSTCDTRNSLAIDTSEETLVSAPNSVFLLDIPPDVVLYLLGDFLNLVDIAHLDSALCHSKHRKHFLSLLANPCIVYQAPAYQSSEFFAYITARRMQISHLSYKLLPPVSRSRSGSMSTTTSGNSAMVSPRSGSFSSPSLSRARSGSITNTIHSLIPPPILASPTNTRASKGPLLRLPSAVLPSAVKPSSGATTVLSLASSSLSPSKDHLLKTRSCSFSLPSPVSTTVTNTSMRSHSIDSIDEQRQVSPSHQSPSQKSSASVAHLTRRIRALSCDAASGKSLHEIVAIYTEQGYIAPTTLQQLSVTGYKKIDDATFLPLLSLCDNSDKIHRTSLVSVDLTGCWKLSDTVLQTLGKMHGKTLQEVNVSACFAFTEDGLAEFFRLCPELRSFTAGFCEKIDDDVVLALLQACPKLRVLKLNACVSLTDDVALHIAQYGQQLEVVDMSGINNLSDDFCKQFHMTQEVKQCFEELFPPPPPPVDVPTETMDAQETGVTAVGGGNHVTNNEVMVSFAGGNDSSIVSDEEINNTSRSVPMTPATTPLYIPPLPEDLLPVALPAAPAPQLPPCCPHLREIHLESCAKLSTEGIVHLVLACRQLQKVQLRYVLGVQQQIVSERVGVVEERLRVQQQQQHQHQQRTQLREGETSEREENPTHLHNEHSDRSNHLDNGWTMRPVHMQRTLSFSI